MVEMGLTENSYMRVEGKFQFHSVYVLSADSSITRSDAVRLNKFARFNVRVKVGDIVRISPFQSIKNAKQLHVLPFQETLEDIGNTHIYETLLKPFFTNVHRPVTEGDIFTIQNGSISVDFRAMLLDPGPSAVVTGKTNIQWSGKPIQRRVDETVLDEVGYDDIGGCDNLLLAIRDVIQIPLRHPQLCKGASSQSPTGILLVGPEGSGKTLIVEAIVNETGAQLIAIDHLKMMGTTVAESEEKLCTAFAKADCDTATIVLITELDILAPHSEKVHLSRDDLRLNSHLSGLIEKAKRKANVIVMATSSRPSYVDPGVLAGFESKFAIPTPNTEGRLEILKICTRRTLLDSDVDLAEIAKSTKGFVGRDLMILCQTAYRNQVREKLPDYDGGNEEQFLRSLVVNHDNFKNAAETLGKNDHSAVPIPSLSLSQVAGYQEVIRELLSLLTTEGQETRSEFGVKETKGILLFGPPGCGKTQMVKAVASKCKRRLILIKGSELLSPSIGVTEENIRKKFSQAESNAPSLLLFDEMESLGAKRGAVVDQSVAADRSVNELLTQIDGVEEDVVIVGTTNRPETLDDALMRDGRLSHMIYLPVPDETSRFDILTHQFRNVPLNKNVSLQFVAASTNGFTCADIAGMCQKACRAAADEAIALKKAATADPDQKYYVEKEHVKIAMDSQRRTLTDEEIKDYDVLADRFLKSAQTSSAFEFPADS